MCKYSFPQAQRSKRLNIGDTLPLISFGNFFESANAVQLNELRGKAVILDFWNTGCVACIKSLPKMDSLQQQFGNKIQIILMTNQSSKQVRNLFSKPKIKKPHIPIVVDDTMFYKKLFPHDGDPLHVWIDSGGIIRAITDGYNATVSHIQSFITEGRIELSSRISQIDIGQNSLLEESCSDLKDLVSSYSLFFSSLNQQTIERGLRLVKDETTSKLSKVSAINIPLMTLYSLAFSKELFGVDVNVHNLQLNNRILIKTKNPLDIRYATADSLLDEWNNRNLVSYEASAVPRSRTDLLTIIQQDLNRYTRFSATIEMKKLTCLVLRRTSKEAKFKTINQNATPYSAYRDSYSIINKSLQTSLVPDLIISNQTGKMPIVDETGFNEPVDMQLNCRLSDLKRLREELRKYDLDLMPADRTIKMLVIRDK
jgi:thiol-disulfide isomerase/thioredoxin